MQGEIRYFEPDALHPLMGRDNVLHHAAQTVQSGHVSHAYLIEGAKGSGKRTFAGFFAMSLLCQEPVLGKPCGRCPSCRLFLSGNHPDLHWIRPDEKNTIPVDVIRERLVTDIAVLPYHEGRKVYIVEQADRLNATAQNVLLKTIEEPPEYGVIFLLAENARFFLPTVRSRCVLIDLKPMENDVVVQILHKGYRIDPAIASSAAAFADGSVGMALQMARSEDFIYRRSCWMGHLSKLGSLSLSEVLCWASELEADKASLDEILRMMMIWFRDLVLLHETGDIQRCFCQDYAEDLQTQVRQFTFERLSQKIEMLTDARKKLEHNVNFALWSDWLLLSLYE